MSQHGIIDTGGNDTLDNEAAHVGLRISDEDDAASTLFLK